MEPRKTPSDRHRGVLNNKSEKTGGRPLCRRAAGSTVSPRRQRTPNAATNPAHERRGLFAYRKGAEGVRVCGHGLRSSERRSGSAGVVCRGSWGRASVRRPLCFWRVHQRPLVATHTDTHTHDGKKPKKNPAQTPWCGTPPKGAAYNTPRRTRATRYSVVVVGWPAAHRSRLHTGEDRRYTDGSLQMAAVVSTGLSCLNDTC